MPGYSKPVVPETASTGISTLSRPRFVRTPLTSLLHIALASGALGLTGWHTPTHAQTSAATQATQSYNIPAGPLSTALAHFAGASGVLVAGAGELATGRTSPGVSGVLTPQAALDALLAGTGLTAIASTDGSYHLRQIPQLPADGVTQLGTVTVRGRISNPDTEGTGSYAAAGPSSTATGLGLTLRETPQSITVMTRQQMEDFNLQTVAQVMEQTPGVFVERYGDSVRFHARGGEISNYQIDGLRVGQKSLADGAPTANGMSGDDTADMDRIEILKGSAGLLQGDGYPTATINMIRKKPTREFQAYINAGAGSWNTYRGDIDVGGPLNEQGSVRARGVFSYKEGDSFRDRASNRNSVLYGVVEWDVTPDTLLNASLSYKTLRNRGGAGWMGVRAFDTDGNPEDDRSRSYNPAPEWSEYKQHVLTATSSLEHHFSEDWKIRLAMNHQQARTPNWINAQIAAPSDAYISRYTGQKDTTQNVGLQVSGNIEAFGRKHELVLGYDFSKTRYDMQRDNPVDYSRYDKYALENFYKHSAGAGFPQPDESEWAWSRGHHSQTIRRGWYATGRVNATDNLKLILGTRISDYSYDYSEPYLLRGKFNATQTEMRERGVVTPYAGIVYDLSQNWTAYASYASVFNPVSQQDEQGRTLPPQKGITYETGFKADLVDGLLSFSAAHFWKRWDKTYEESGGLTPTGNPAFRNVNGAMERGYEFELTGQLTPGWQVQAGYVMNNSSLNGSTNRPKHQFKLASNYQFSGDLNGLTLGAAARWQSVTVAQSYARLEQPAYWVFDAMARYRFNRQWSASLNVNNLFDKKYYASVNGMAGWGMYYTWGAPRNAFLNVRYEF